MPIGAHAATQRLSRRRINMTETKENRPRTAPRELTTATAIFVYRTYLISCLAVVLLFAFGCSQAKNVPAVATKQVGGLDVTFTTSPWPPHSGDITGIVAITDVATKLTVDNASVVASANMTAPVANGSPVSGRYQGGGRYDVPLRLVATTYNISIHIEQPGRTAVDVDFPIEAWQ